MDLTFLSRVIGFIIALSIHEFAHAMIANKLGDPTAKYKGRLSLNPIKHIDPFGTILLPLLISIQTSYIFGYAKPVPVNPYNLKGKYSELWVSLAGPASNLIIAFLTAFLFNLIPETITGNWSKEFVELIIIIAHTNVAIGIFNLLPFAPLDGSKILFSLLPPSMSEVREFIERYSIIGIFLIIFFAGKIMGSIINLIMTLFFGGYEWIYILSTAY